MHCTFAPNHRQIAVPWYALSVLPLLSNISLMLKNMLLNQVIRAAMADARPSLRHDTTEYRYRQPPI